MAGDWIKVETCLPDKPEVHQIAQELGIDPDAVVGKLIRVWSYFDTHTEDGNAPNVTRALLERYTCNAGIVQAMVNAGWMVAENGTLSLPHFDRHNGQTGKRRALTKDRVARHRNASVTQKVLPEKRREEGEKKNTPLPPKGADVRSKAIQAIPESLAARPGCQAAVMDWWDYKRERGQTYKPRGWKALMASLESGDLGADGGVAAIRASMAANYAGLFAPKPGQNGTGKPWGGQIPPDGGVLRFNIREA